MDKLALGRWDSGLSAQLARFEACRVEPAIAARAKEITFFFCDGHNMNRICQSAENVYLWVSLGEGGERCKYNTN